MYKVTDYTIYGEEMQYVEINLSPSESVVAEAGSGGDGAILDGVSSSIRATVLDYTNSNPIAVRLTDTNGDYVTGGGGGGNYLQAKEGGSGIVILRW